RRLDDAPQLIAIVKKILAEGFRESNPVCCQQFPHFRQSHPRNLTTNGHQWTRIRKRILTRVRRSIHFEKFVPISVHSRFKTSASTPAVSASCASVMVSGGVKLMTFACPPSGSKMKPR